MGNAGTGRPCTAESKTGDPADDEMRRLRGHRREAGAVNGQNPRPLAVGRGERREPKPWRQDAGHRCAAGFRFWANSQA